MQPEESWCIGWGECECAVRLAGTYFRAPGLCKQGLPQPSRPCFRSYWLPALHHWCRTEKVVGVRPLAALCWEDTRVLRGSQVSQLSNSGLPSGAQEGKAEEFPWDLASGKQVTLLEWVDHSNAVWPPEISAGGWIYPYKSGTGTHPRVAGCCVTWPAMCSWLFGIFPKAPGPPGLMDRTCSPQQATLLGLQVPSVCHWWGGLSEDYRLHLVLLFSWR